MVYLMENGMSSSKEKQVIVDIESDKIHVAQVNRETISGNKQGKRSLDKLASGALDFNGSSDGEASVKSEGVSGGSLENPAEALDLLIDKNIEEQQRLIDKGNEKERRKAGKIKKAAKPPRPPNGPTLYPDDLRLIDELARLAMKKRERMERIKALKMMQATKSSSSPSTSLLSTHGSTILAMLITVFFLLVVIFQGLVSNASSGSSPAAAPQPALPEMLGVSPVQFYKSVFTDDSVPQSFVPSKATVKDGEGPSSITIN